MATKEAFQNAGDFILDGVLVVGSSGEAINIQNLVREINIYQSLDSPFMSGNMMISDSEGISELLPFLGQERLIFQVRTPNAESTLNYNRYNAIIYNVEARFQTSERMQSLVLNFTTLEHYKNIRTKISSSFNGTISQIVEKILTDATLLGTKKKVHIDITKNIRKYVIPNLNPFQTINLLKEEAVSLEEQAPHFLFYENPDGFHFRSLDSLLGSKRSLSVSHKHTYSASPPGGEDPPEKSMTTILSWVVEDNTNHFLSTKLGMFGSTLYTHDIFNKNIQKFEFDYTKDSFDKRNATDQDLPAFGSLVSQGIIDVNEKKTITEFPNSKVYVHPSASDKLHSVGTDNNADEWLQESISRELEREYFTLKIETYGNTNIMVGDIIDVVIPANKPLTASSGANSVDNILSGRYLITSLHHMITPTENNHRMTLTIMKNSVRKATAVRDVNYEKEPAGGTDVGLSATKADLKKITRQGSPPPINKVASGGPG